MDSNIYVYINGVKTSLLSLAASSGISYATILARYKAGVAPESLTAGAKAVLDTVPTAGSTNGITSGAVFTANAGKIDKASGATAGNIPKLKSDGTLEDSGIALPAGGVWEPTFTYLSGYRDCRYYRFGNMVFIYGTLVFGTMTSSSDGIDIGGLPVNIVNYRAMETPVLSALCAFSVTPGSFTGYTSTSLILMINGNYARQVDYSGQTVSFSGFYFC